MIPKIPNAPASISPSPATGKPDVASGPTKPFPQVEQSQPTAQADGPQGAEPTQPAGKPANLLNEINKPYAELERLEQEVLSRLKALETGPQGASDPAALRTQTTELLWIQMRIGRAALAVQLSAKTIEMTTTGINTLARTQT